MRPGAKSFPNIAKASSESSQTSTLKDASVSATNAKNAPAKQDIEEPKKAGNVATTTAPFTPRRPNLQTRLSLQMPSRTRPLSPILDPAQGYSTIRRPRDRLDFARACTSLHHSTLADTSDSSPLGANLP